MHTYGLKSLQQFCAKYGVIGIMYSLIHFGFVLMTHGDLKWRVGQEAKERFCSGFPFIHEQGIEDIFPVVAVGLVNLYLFLFSEYT